MFDFGKNWREFSLRLLDDRRLNDATKSLRTLLEKDSLDGKSFLDVGCGTGLFTIAAMQLGAQPALDMDVNPLCIQVSRQNAEILSNSSNQKIAFQLGNALDETGLSKLGEFDVVYAWGSLHHTGDMYRAIRLVAGRVAAGGTFVLAIYNTHLTSPIWRIIKRIYNLVPALLQRLMVLLFGGVIYIAKFAVTRRNPLESQRGMDFWVDVVDWVGGYPYEYATPSEIEAFVMELGFSHIKTVQPVTPTGCNEFVFVNNAPAAH